MKTFDCQELGQIIVTKGECDETGVPVVNVSGNYSDGVITLVFKFKDGNEEDRDRCYENIGQEQAEAIMTDLIDRFEDIE